MGDLFMQKNAADSISSLWRVETKQHLDEAASRASANFFKQEGNSLNCPCIIQLPNQWQMSEIEVWKRRAEQAEQEAKNAKQEAKKAKKAADEANSRAEKAEKQLEAEESARVASQPEMVIELHKLLA